ncbi:MAG TPA: hypothetical protein VKT77_10205, partial [Chthonomonadaceae bacterium]|nr:hypothetical protein [Chthonomonadaceae bacterium]
MANIAIDWIVYRSGDNASLTDDYRPISSSGLIAADLTDEVVRVCRAHYQISEPMPAEQDVWFFWPAREAKGAYVAMQGRRVPDPSGQKRPAAAYTALLLSDEKYDLFSRNPVALFEDHGRGFEKAAEYAAQQSRDPIIVSRSDSASSAAPPSPAGSAAFESGQPVAWSPVADADLRRYIAAQIVVPSFVTWWPSASPPPAGLFRIVLQATVAVRRTVLEELDWLSNRLLELGNEALGSPEAQRNILYNGMQEILQRASSAALGAQGLLREGLEEKNRDRWPEAQRQIRAAAEESSKQLDLGLSAPLRALPPHLVAGFEQVKKGFSDFATRIEMERHPARPSFQSEATAEGARRVPAGRTTETAHPPAEDRRPDGPRRDD